MATLFSVECTTCHRRLQVRKKSAIGQIVNCPACGSMLQIAPPPGWVPPADEPVEAKVKAPSATNPTAKPVATADASIASQKPAPPSPAPAAGRVPTPEELLAATADQPGFPWDKVILAGAVVTALAVVGVGIWVIADGGRKTPVATNAEATIETTAPAAAPLSTAAAPAPTGLETTTAATPQPTGEATAPQAVPAATSEATGAAPAATSDAPQAAPPETDPPMNPAPGDPAMPAPNAPQEGPAEPLPPAAPMPAPEPEAPRAPLPAAVDVDVPARMADPLKKVEFSDLPLSEAVDFVAQLTGLSITLDVDGIAQAGATPSDKVSAKLRDSTVGDLLDTILTQRGLAYVVEEGRVRVTARAAQAGEVVTAAFNVADLDGGDSAKTESLATMIRTVVTPGVWETDKAVKLIVAPGQIMLTHHAEGCQRAAEFLDKLRLARGMALIPSPVLAPRTVLETRIGRVREKLMRPMLGNFKDDALEKILRYFERQAEMNLLVDNLALAQVGLTPDVKTTLSGVKDEPIWMALERLLDPLGLAYRAIDQQTLQITSRNALLEQFDLEAYKISDLVPDKFPLDDFLAKLQALIEPGSWGEFNPGAVVYDAQSGTMFVRHHQIAQGQIEDWLATIRAPVKKDAGANEPANAGGGQKPEPKTAAPKNTASKKVAP